MAVLSWYTFNVSDVANAVLTFNQSVSSKFSRSVILRLVHFQKTLLWKTLLYKTIVNNSSRKFSVKDDREQFQHNTSAIMALHVIYLNGARQEKYVEIMDGLISKVKYWELFDI